MKRKHNQTSIPGFGCIYLPTYRSKAGELKNSAVWWMKYETANGEVVRSTKTRDQGEAIKELRKVAGNLATGVIVNKEPEKVLVGQLLDLLIESYAVKRTLYGLTKQVNKHLRPAFGSMRAIEMGTRELKDFVASMKKKKLAPGTVNRYLANLRRAFELGRQHDPPLVLRIPGFPYDPAERDNARQGRMTHEQYERLRDDLAPHARLALVIGYHIGMRRGEILGLRWDQVDWEVGVLRLERKQTKNKTERTAPIYGEMRGFLEMAKAERDAKYPNCQHVVAYDGHRMYYIEGAWKAGLRRLKLPNILFHDLRRTAATNMRKAGIDELTVMRLLGWKSPAMFRRYNITSLDDTIEAGRTMEAWHLGQRATGEGEKGSVQ